MKIHVNLSAVLGAVCIGLATVVWAFAQSFVSTVYANDKLMAVHEQKITGIEAMRPQVLDILMKVDSMEKAMRQMRERRCRTSNKTEGD